MKSTFLIAIIGVLVFEAASAQSSEDRQEHKKEIKFLIYNYTKAREAKDTNLLDHILTDDIDQLVSSGTWRRGKDESMKGMLRSSTNNPGKRTITVDQIRFIGTDCAIADARYEIENADGSVRKMWSTFIVVQQEDDWKISGIRNMKPAG